MKKGLLSYGFILWVILASAGAYLLWSKYAKLRFGIDLVGGTYITLDVGVEKAIQSNLEERLLSLKKNLKRNHVPEPVSAKIENGTLTLKFASPADVQAASPIIKTSLSELERDVQGNSFIVRFPASVEEQLKANAVESVRDVLDQRLNKHGTSEVLVATKGKRNIIIELPDVRDREKAKAMIGTPAMLEFKIVEKMSSSEDGLLEDTDGEIPEGLTVVPGIFEGGSGAVSRKHYLLPAYAELTGNHLVNAYAGIGSGTHGNEPVIHFKLSSAGAELFGELTSQNYGRNMAIVLDDEVICAPSIGQPIHGGEAYIHGRFTWDSAKDLAMMLKTGAFAAPVKFIEERDVKATLGEEAIRKGLRSCVIGLILLFLFSLYYYGMAGLFAFIALLFNMLLILLGLSWLNSTLTLPGIAGMVLTVGMAVDASILIYERIKEELSHGTSSFKAAVSEGFNGAMGVILDANITTFIVGVVLYNFGTGPIKGFAVTTMLGIVATLITGLFFLRSIFTFVLSYLGFERVKI